MHQLGFFKQIKRAARKVGRVATFPVKLSLKLANKAAAIACSGLAPALTSIAAQGANMDPAAAARTREAFCRAKAIGDQVKMKQLLPSMVKIGAQLELARRAQNGQAPPSSTKTVTARKATAVTAAQRSLIRALPARREMAGAAVLLTEDEARALSGVFGSTETVRLTEREAAALLGVTDDPETTDTAVLLGVLATPDDEIIEALATQADIDEMNGALGVVDESAIARVWLALGLTAVAGVALYGAVRGR